MQDPLPALRASVQRLQNLVGSLQPGELSASAYPAEWTIADVLSHLGSAAVIFERRLEDALGGATMPGGFAESVWNEWNAKAPAAQATDALAADRAALERLESLTPDERARLRVDLGPLSIDYPEYVALRLNELALHTWDVEAALHPDATLPPDATAVVIDNLSLTARYTAKPTGTTETIVVRTSEPTRTFTIALTPDAVTTGEGNDSEPADVELPAEAFIRLVYGRLDPDHTPAGVTGEHHLHDLRKVFPGP
jgi:uncharacterized protein (TIGR03083 family)